MSDDVEFQMLTRSLTNEDLGKRVIAINRLRRSLSIAAAFLALLALTVIMAFTNTAPLLITLAVVGVIAIEIGRVGFASSGESPARSRTPGNDCRRPDSDQPGHPAMSTGCTGLTAHISKTNRRP